MRGEHRTNVEAVGNAGDETGVEMSGLDPLDRRRELAAVAPVTDAMVLFREIGQREVGAEGANELNRRIGIESGDEVFELL